MAAILADNDVTGHVRTLIHTSLESSIRELNTPQSLPVITIANVQRMFEREYAGRAADKLLTFLEDIEQLRGSGRLYIP